ncbi:DUF2459 domain-containing protein [Scytonema millei]|uniref:DUF2459 domain-containing protein n=1 Tax=Scytonema millei VB511283 TaxID=1245923 RepID=A0A9X5E0X3_9CYAN|nr:DUF2459 domain-containing protein [Scytonema millei]NHC33385.1 DUF2459 domain-containing protein [Scytonema millei VB511283]
MKLRRFIILFLAIASIFLVGWICSPATIVPPGNPINPVNIYLIDYGFHARLILPSDRDNCLEYAYGDWKYFALNQQDWLTGAAALFLPTQGALGRKLKNCDRFDLLATQKDNFLLSITVDKTKVDRLLKVLNSYFDRPTTIQIENSYTGMTLVPYDRTYTVLHNSNHELVRWLENLGCRVEGFVLWANFKSVNS